MHEVIAISMMWPRTHCTVNSYPIIIASSGKVRGATYGLWLVIASVFCELCGQHTLPQGQPWHVCTRLLVGVAKLKLNKFTVTWSVLIGARHEMAFSNIFTTLPNHINLDSTRREKRVRGEGSTAEYEKSPGGSSFARPLRLSAVPFGSSCTPQTVGPESGICSLLLLVSTLQTLQAIC